MHKVTLGLLAACAVLVAAGHANAQQPAAPASTVPAAPPPYGETISIEMAKKAAAGAVEEAKKNNWGMCVTVVAPSGDLVYFERMDNCQYASINISQHKARVAATFRRPTLALENALAAGQQNLYLLTLDGMIGSRGGNPIVVNGKLIGAIGVSGGTGAQDDQCSQAGVAALK